MADRAPQQGAGAERAGAAAAKAGRFASGILGRIARSFGHLEPAQRLSVYGALAMVVTMFLPWYSKSVTAIVTQGRDQALANRSENLSAWASFSFVEAAALLVAAGVLLLLFRRGEGRGFHLPGGDGTVIAAAGGWAAFLIFYRLLDQPDAEKTATLNASYGLSWGIFFALGAALFLASTGVRLRAARVTEPPLPAAVREPRRPRAPVPEIIEHEPEPETGATRVDSSLQPTRVAPDGRPRARAAAPPPPREDGTEQLSFDEREM